MAKRATLETILDCTLATAIGAALAWLLVVWLSS